MQEVIKEENESNLSSHQHSHHQVEENEAKDHENEDPKVASAEK